MSDVSQRQRDELSELATEAYLYLYPLVLMEFTRQAQTNVALGERVGRAPMGVLTHLRAFPPTDFKTVVRPNYDTLYSTGWFDVTHEPYVLHVPAIRDRFFMLPLYDFYTDVFASPGTRTHGETPLTLAVCHPDWRGSLPDGVRRVNATTPTVWFIGRTETRGVADYEAVHAIQDQMWLRPLSRMYEDVVVPASVPDPAAHVATPPMARADQLSAEEFFTLGWRLRNEQGSHASDWSQLARLERAGFIAGDEWRLASLSDAHRAAIDAAPAAARREIAKRFATLVPFVNGWSTILETMGTWGNAYLRRTMIAMFGLGANPPEESLYPNTSVDADGAALNGANKYVVHFAAGELPPVDAFWSLTVYDPKGFPVPNEYERVCVSDRDGIVLNDDGSLDLYLQEAMPSDVPLSNWLPVPAGNFVLTLRLYLPHTRVLTGQWSAPPVRRR